MEKNYKISRGMTLVEVIVAMTIFAIMAAAITGVMLRANKMSNRAKMRDTELATETNIIGRNKSTAQDALQGFDPDPSYSGDYTIVFTQGAKNKDIKNVKVYQTDQGRFDDEFGFQLKTVIPASSIAGLPLTNLNDNEYALRFSNTLAESVNVTFKINEGYLFEGNGQSYIHTTRSYVKTIPANTSVDIGYYCANVSDSTEISVQFDTGVASAAVGGLRASAKVRPKSLDADLRTAVFEVNASGEATNPTFDVTLTTPTE